MEKKKFDFEKLKYPLLIMLTTVMALAILVMLRVLAGDAVRKAFGALKPVVYGIIIALLFKPLCNLLERVFSEIVLRKLPKKHNRMLSTVFSIVITYIIWGIILYFVFALLLQQVSKSLAAVVASFPGFVNDMTAWVSDQMENNELLANNAETIIRTVTSAFTNWYNTYFFPTITNLTNGMVKSFTFIFNVCVGFIVSVYLLINRKRFAWQAKLIIKSIFNENGEKFILEEADYADDMFSGFFFGKVIDSAIVGIVCYGACLVMRIPYAELVSVIVGITNLIPFFGPYIGMIPSAVIVLTVSPVRALMFLIMDWLLQQIDGNILGPRILGRTMDLSSFWVLFSILAFGGMFGFLGMIIGVPVFAVIYHIVERFVKSRLKKKDKAKEWDDYHKEYPEKERNKKRPDLISKLSKSNKKESEAAPGNKPSEAASEENADGAEKQVQTEV